MILTYGLLDLTSCASERLSTVAVIAVFTNEFNTCSAVLTGTGVTCAHSHDWWYSGLKARIEDVMITLTFVKIRKWMLPQIKFSNLW